MATDTYVDFWSKMFGLSSKELSSSTLSIVTAGHYVERHQDKYVFFYYDEFYGKKILACSEKNLMKTQEITGEILNKLDIESIRDALWFREADLAFRDIDFCLASKNSFKSVDSNNFDIRPLEAHQTAEIEKFYSDCTEDDKDTLDLTFENEVALGIYQNSVLAGIARYTQIRSTAIADITVLVRKAARSQGLSTPLVSRLVDLIFVENLFPKYRVEESNLSSIAIAKKLGFQPRFRILTWEA